MVRGFLVLPRPLLSDEVVKPPIVSKATVQRCISKLSPHWTDYNSTRWLRYSGRTGLLECLGPYQGGGSKLKHGNSFRGNILFFE